MYKYFVLVKFLKSNQKGRFDSVPQSSIFVGSFYRSFPFYGRMCNYPDFRAINCIFGAIQTDFGAINWYFGAIITFSLVNLHQY